MKKLVCITLVLCMVFALAGCGGEVGGSTPKKPDYIDINADESRTNDVFGFQLDQPKKGEEIAVLHTTMGDIKMRLFMDSAPIAVTNFIALAKDGKYDGTTFHRVINDFMIQTGIPANESEGKSIWGADFKTELNANLLHLRGAVSMAHRGKDTNSCQFFIVQNPTVTEAEFVGAPPAFTSEIKNIYTQKGGTPFLDGIGNPEGHAVFAQVFEGMDIVDQIAAVETDSGDAPVEEIKITSVEIVKYEN